MAEELRDVAVWEIEAGRVRDLDCPAGCLDSLAGGACCRSTIQRCKWELLSLRHVEGSLTWHGLNMYTRSISQVLQYQ